MTKTNKSFFAFGEEVVEGCRRAGRLGTARNYERTLSSFAAFCGEAAGNGLLAAGSVKRLDTGLTFGDVTPMLLVDYEHWLYERGVMRNSSSFYMRNLRSIFNKAVAVGAARTGDPFAGVYTGIDTTRKRAAGEDLVLRLLRLDLRCSAALALARDLFVFSYCTRGMAFVDVAYLRKEEIRDGVISYVRRKTGQRLTVGVEPCMELIINRYSDETAGSPYVFPIIMSSDPAVAYEQYRIALNYHNRKLKRLASLLGEPLRLSSYTARHTWATAARNHNVPLSVISAGMGHASEKTTQIYLAALDEAVIDKANRGLLGEINSVVSA